MSESIDLRGQDLLALTRASLLSLRSALLRSGDPQSAVALQEAGYAGGTAFFGAFSRWLADRTDLAVEDLDVETFEQRLSEFFRETGWGTVTIGTMDDVVATLDSENWSEADAAGAQDMPSCHLTTGMFADLFGRLAAAPVAVLEVECRSAGQPRCRFLVGSAEVMDAVYREMERGVPYQDAIRATA